MESPKRICRLCLEVVSDDYDTLDKPKSEMLEKICPNLVLAPTDDPLVCLKCLDGLRRAYDFKISCLNNEKYLEPFLDPDSDMKLNLEEIIQRNASNAGVKHEEESICRLCLRYFSTDSFVKFVVDEDMYLEDILRKCLPEIELGITNRPLMCCDCMLNCKNMFNFVTNCLSNEEKVKKYLQVNGNGKLNLSNVLIFVKDVKNDVKAIHADLNFTVEKKMEVAEDIKHEEILDGVGKGTSCDVIVKQEKFEPLAEGGIDEKGGEDASGKAEIADELNSASADGTSNNLQMHRCTECGYEGKRKAYLRKHMLVHKNRSEVTMYQCTECTFESKHKSNLQQHLLIHGPKDNNRLTMHKCTECTHETKSKSSLRKHMLTHKNPSETTMYKCAECSFASKHRNSLLYHLLVHKDNSKVTMHKCTECNFESKHKKSLLYHSLTHKDSSEVTMYKCTQCGFESKHKISIQSHMLTHKDSSEVVMHKCTECSFESKYKTSLQSHMLTHKDSSEVTWYKCTDCSFKSRHKASLRRHTCFQGSTV